MKKNTWVNVLVVVVVLVLAVLILLNANENPQTDEETAKCIGARAILYVQLGCSHCDNQENMFGDYKEHLTVIDCFYEREKCEGIEGTPTWEISGEKIRGVQSIDKLKELTGC